MLELRDHRLEQLDDAPLVPSHGSTDRGNLREEHIELGGVVRIRVHDDADVREPVEVKRLLVGEELLEVLLPVVSLLKK